MVQQTTVERSRRLRFPTAAVVAVAALCLVIAGCSSSGTSSSKSAASTQSASANGPVTAKKASLVLDWTWQPYHLPFMYGTSFDSDGVTLSLTQGQGSGTSATLVGQGKYDFGFVDTSTAILSQAKGVPIQNVLVIQKSAAFATECWKSANVNSPADLKGHSVIMVPGESAAQVWPAYLAANNVDPSSVKVVSASISNKVTLFVAHQADCMAGLVGEDTLQASLANSGIGQPMPWSQSSIDLFGYSLVASTAIIKSDPALVKSMVAATIASWKNTCANQSSALDYFTQHYPQLATSAADKSYNTGNLDAACGQLVPPSGVTSTPLGKSDPQQWQANLTTLQKYGGLTTTQPATAFYTNDFIPTS